ncbi:MAG: hypothetical protein K2Y33_00345 [Mycolicibacterium frederiksbergense]|uniref:Uncharacterized protein n=1 Tax=Mycolicibacterium frederiksbergense TaxID=117567 RepID=A0A6H0S4S0_9MYCO|nr:hypothetical protein [Mycolicibacterium frederiksbergense]MBX9918272.1 hypothetical protein [Mycolicibacterium frederiksbergense]QIV82150.1 hypothetical protein EXE63_15655 [Mycolicibacterium frederiksbergense]
MNDLTRRIATGFAVAAAPAIIAVGAAATCHAQATAVNTYGLTTSQAAATQQGHAAQTGVTSLSRRHHHGYYHRR